jgi:glycerol-3-phosphate acyltransferase PlsX
MRVAVDVLGGDYAPGEILKGVTQALLSEEFRADELLLAGPEALIADKLREAGVSNLPAVLDTDQVIEGHEKPIEGLRAKPKASVLQCVGAVKQGAADGLIAFGNTGATVAAATMGLGMLPGIRRPGIAVTLQGAHGSFVLLDVGANPSPKPNHMFQYALMGAAYAKDLLAIERPRIGLLNIGGEATKGNSVLKETHAALAAGDLNFVGNVEGNHLFSGEADVYVADGFVGNMVLKVVEGFAEFLVRAAREQGESVREALRGMVGAAEFSEVGGATLLGVDGVVLIGHGRSKADAVLSALRAVRKDVDKGVNRHIVENLEAHREEEPAAE